MAPEVSKGTQKDYEIFLERRRELANERSQQSSSFDKHILYVSAGSFAVFPVIYGLFSLGETVWTKYLTLFIMSFFLLSIAATLITFFLSVLTIENTINELDSQWKKNKHVAKEYPQKYVKIIKFLNFTSMFSFVVAVIFIFFIFIII